MTNPAVNDDDDDPPAPAAVRIPLMPTTGKQRVLLAIVIILGVLIVLAFGALVGGLLMGAGRSAQSAKPWTYTVDVPAGTRVAGPRVDGDRMLVHLTSQAGDDVVLIDTKTGKVVGRIHVKPPQ
jgi:hypothetical protein